MSKREDFYSVAEASEALGKSVPTIYRWLRDDRLVGIRNPLTGRYIILQADLESAQRWI